MGGDVYVARHGETDWNREGRYQGRLESQLTSLGLAQAARLADELARRGIKRLIASPLQRCLATAELVRSRVGCGLEVDSRLIEIDHGKWQGRLRDDVAREDEPRFRSWRDAPAEMDFEGGESLADVRVRWRAFASAFDARVNTAIVTHDVLVRVALLEARSKELDAFWEAGITNGAFAHFWVSDKTWRIVRVCEMEHLAGLASDLTGQAL